MNRFLTLTTAVLVCIFLSCGEDTPPASSEANITSFSLAGVSGSISGSSITLSVPYGTDISSLSPQITNSPKSTITPAAGTSRDFSSPVTYVVTAEDGTTTTSYTITVTILDPDQVVISRFEVEGSESVDIDESAKTITINVNEGSDVTQLTPKVTTIPADASVTPATGAANDFSSAVKYNVKAGSKSQDYTVSINFLPIGFDPETVVDWFQADVASGTLEPELGAEGDNERGFSLNSTHVYVADRGDGVIYFWENDGSSASASSLKDDNSVISGGTFVLADVIATENGILGSNMSLDGSAFKVYRWNDNDSNAELILSYPATRDGANIRLGDNFNFHGDPQGEGTLYATPSFTTKDNYVLVWNLENGEVVNAENPDIITFEDINDTNKIGNYGFVEPVNDGDKHYLLVNAAQITPTLYSTDGTTRHTQISSEAIIVRAMGGKIFEFNQKRYLALATVGTEGANTRDAGVWIYDISGDSLIEEFDSFTDENVAEKLVYSNSFGQNININQAGDVDIYINEEEGAFYTLVGAANNGFRIIKAVKAK